MPSGMTSPAELLVSVIAFARRQIPVILFVTAICVGLGLVYAFTTPPLFDLDVSLIIDTRNVQLFQKQPILGENPIDTGMVESEVQILELENISLAVIKKFHLADNPEFIGPGGGLLGALIGSVSNLFGSDAPQSEYERTRHAAAVFANRLTVKRIGLSYVIQISFQSHNPQLAADIANAVADTYIDDQLEAKFQAARRAGVWLQDRLRELREQSLTAERAVVEFKAKNNIVSTGGTDKRLVDQQQVSELNSQLVIARAKEAEARARLDRIQAVLTADLPDASLDATVSDTLKDDVITKLRSQYLELAAREDDWAKRYGTEHLAVVNLRNQMSEIQSAILSELRRIGESEKSDYEIAKQGETAIQKQLAQAVGQSQVTDRAEVELTELESNAQSYRALYDDFLQRYMELVQQESFPITEARVVTPATRPLSKSSPKLSLVLLISAAGGMLLGLGIGRLRDLSDRVFRTRSQVEDFLGLDCLATLPKLDTSGDVPPDQENNQMTHWPKRADQTSEQMSLALGAVGESSKPRTIAPRHDILWHVVDYPLSPFTELIRSIKMAANFGGTNKSNRIIGITSSLPDEGKSTIAASIAQLIAHSGKRVILIDCDLRASKLTRSLTPDTKAGLLEVASGEADLDQVIWTDQSSNLRFLPTFETHRLLHTAEIVESDEMKTLFDKLRKIYDYVIVDLPPLVPNVDVRATRGLVDCYVFVIEWGRTKIDLIERALKEASIGDNVLGVVLNKVRGSGLQRYEGYGSYEHNKYYYSTPVETVSWLTPIKSFARGLPDKFPDQQQTAVHSRRALKLLHGAYRRYVGGRRQ